ncbi:MAG: hypothetical protein ACRBCT_06160 [Alphaproteobacteria bacterium]
MDNIRDFDHIAAMCTDQNISTGCVLAFGAAAAEGHIDMSAPEIDPMAPFVS